MPCGNIANKNLPAAAEKFPSPVPCGNCTSSSPWCLGKTRNNLGSENSLCTGLCVQITLSHKLSGRLGLLEREAAAILNASLQPLAAAVIPSYSAALKQLGLQHVPLYLTGNDGTLMAAAMAQEYPVLTFRR